MRAYTLTQTFRDAYTRLDPSEQVAVSDVVAELVDEDFPLVRADDVPVGPIVGRRAPGTSLVVGYVPAGPNVFLVNIRRW